MEEDKIKRVKPLNDNPVTVDFSHEIQKHIPDRAKVASISEADIDIEADDAGSVFESGRTTGKFEVFLPGEGKFSVSGIVKTSGGNRSRIAFQDLSVQSRTKLARYILHQEQTEKIRLKI